MPLLIVPLVILLLLALWVLLLPVALWQRYRLGKARQRAWPWLVKLNAWMLLASLLLFLASMAVTQFWWPGAISYAVGGVVAGLLLGWLGLWASRFEYTPQGLYYTPNPWLGAYFCTARSLINLSRAFFVCPGSTCSPAMASYSAPAASLVIWATGLAKGSLRVRKKPVVSNG